MDDYICLINLYAGPVSQIPKGYTLCDGRILPITGNQALFAVMGSKFGGDGKTTFALPDLRGRVPIGALVGTAPNPKFPELSTALGGNGGVNTIALQQTNIPGHTHPTGVATASNAQGTTGNPAGGILASSSATDPNGEPVTFLAYVNNPESTSLVNMNPSALTVQPVGGAPHNNMMPYVGLNYIICTNGLFPPHDN